MQWKCNFFKKELSINYFEIFLKVDLAMKIAPSCAPWLIFTRLVLRIVSSQWGLIGPYSIFFSLGIMRDIVPPIVSSELLKNLLALANGNKAVNTDSQSQMGWQGDQSTYSKKIRMDRWTYKKMNQQTNWPVKQAAELQFNDYK